MWIRLVWWIGTYILEEPADFLEWRLGTKTTRSVSLSSDVTPCFPLAASTIGVRFITPFRVPCTVVSISKQIN